MSGRLCDGHGDCEKVGLTVGTSATQKGLAGTFGDTLGQSGIR